MPNDPCPSGIAPNVDSREIAKFDAVASQWWDLQGDFQPLHRINPLRLDYILSHAGGLFGKTVLDVGCGGGILTESMAAQGASLTGLDMGEQPLAIARQHARESQLAILYLQQAVEQHAEEKPGHYDAVTCMEMLEHVPDPASVVRACARLVKPGGDVFFSTLNRNPKAWLMAIVGAEYVLHMVPRGTHDIRKFIKPAELLHWIDGTSLRERHITGLHYHPFSNRFTLGGDVDVNYMLHCRRRP